MKTLNPKSRVTLKHHALVAALGAALFFGGGSSAHAASITWNVAGDGAWDTTSSNWSTDGGATTTTFISDGSEDAIFTAGTAGHTITISPGMSPASTTVSGDYNFSGQPVATGSLTKSGGGTLTLLVTPANFSSIAVQGGTLYLRADQFAGGNSFNIGNVTVESGAVLEGERAYMVGGTLTLNGGTYWEDNGFAGGWTGPVTLSADSYFGQNGWCMSQSINGEISGPGGLTWLGGQYGATLTLNGTNTYTGKTIVRKNALQYNVPLSNAGVAGALGAPTGDSAVIDLYPGTTFVYGGPQGSMSPPLVSTDRTINLAGSGPGTVTLNGSNVNDTGFQFGGFSATGTGTRTLLINCRGDRPVYTYTGGIPDMSDSSQVSLTCTWSSGSSSSNGLINLQGINAFTGPITLNGGGNGGPGTFLIGGSASNYSTVVPGGTGVLGNGNYAGNITFTANPASVLLYHASSVGQTLSGAISGPGAVTVGGTGILTLGGANTYSGNTTVNAGCKLRLTQKAALGTATSVYLSDSSELNLDFAAPDMVQVAQLFVNGTQQPVGLYKAVGSAASGTELAQIKSTSTGRLLVGIPLIADFTATPSISGDAPLPVTFTDSSVSVLGTLNSWSWNFGDGTSSSAQNPGVHTYALWGTYTVTLTVGDTTGLFTTTTKTITVTQPLNLVVSSEGQFENAIVNVGPTNTVTFNTGLGGNPDFGGLTGKGTVALKDSANAAVTLEVGSNTLANGTFGGVLTDAGGLTKVGTNTFTLSGQNTYLGDTVVNAGVLQLQGEVITPGLVAEFYNGNNTGNMGTLSAFNTWCAGHTLYLSTTTVAYQGGSGHYPAHARLWYPDAGNHFYDMGFNTAVLPSVDVNNNYSVRLTGKLKIVQAGTYDFTVNSDDGSVIYVDGQLLDLNDQGQGMADNNNPSALQNGKHGTIILTSGYHDIVIGMNEGGGGHGLNVSYNGPDTASDDGSPVGSNPQYPSQGNVNGWVYIPNSVLGVVTPGGNDILPTGTILRINSPGILNITSGTHTINKLYLDGIGQAAGTWGSTASTATNKNDTYFSGIGVLTVTSAGTGNYTSWASAQTPPLTGGPSAVGHDGLTNLVVYALNLKTNGTNGSPGTLTGNVLSFAKRPDAVTNGDVSYAIETSPDLQNPWTIATPDVNNGSTISYTLPSGQGKIFARLKVTGP